MKFTLSTKQAIALITLSVCGRLTLAASAPSSDDFVTLPFAAPLKQISKMDKLREAFSFIQNEASVAQILKNADQGLALDQIVENDGLETTKFQAHFQGLEVIGSQVLFHKSENGDNDITNDLADFDLNTRPVLSKEDAVGIAKSLSGGSDLFVDPSLKILPDKESRSAKLIYIVKLQADIGKEAEGGKDLWVDAQTGELIAEIPHQQEIAPIDVLVANSNCQQLDQNGNPLQINPKACQAVFTGGSPVSKADTASKNAFNNSQKTLNFYLSNFKRNGFDNKGSRLVSIVHIGNKFNNAFWNSELNIMGYGDGDGVKFKNFTSGTDVAGHELTHGITSQTAKLQYLDESGALNEAFSDFFGVMISGSTTWEIGKDLMVDAKARGIRDLANPNSMRVMKTKRNANGDPVLGQDGKPIIEDLGPYPDKMSQKFPKQATCSKSLNDNCWVHINSTIQGHASYLVAQAIGRDKAMKLFYTALTQFLGPTDGFVAAKAKIMKACSKVLDTTSCGKVTAAYKQVGL